jgi:hypothetical protein
MLDMVLKRKGYQADLSVDGSECLEIIKEKGNDYYDMIFMDNMMPIMVNYPLLFVCLFINLKFGFLRFNRMDWKPLNNSD